MNDKIKEVMENAGFVDWNELQLEQMARYLEDKYIFSSSGEALCIHKLIEFYDKHKDNAKV